MSQWTMLMNLEKLNSQTMKIPPKESQLELKHWEDPNLKGKVTKKTSNAKTTDFLYYFSDRKEKMNPTETAKQILLQIVDGVVNTSFNKLVAESSDIVPEGTAGNGSSES